MRQHITVLLVLLLLAGKATAQPVADSFETALKKHTAPDSTRLNLLLGFCSKTYNTEKAMVAAEEAIALSEKLSLPDKLAKALVAKASSFLEEGKDSLYLEYLEKAAALYEKSKDKKGSATILRGKGRYYQSIYKYYTAIGFFEQSLPIFESINASNFLSYVNNDIGSCYFALGEYNQAINYYLRSNKYARQGNDMQVMAMTTANIAMANKDLKLYKTSIEKYREAIGLYQAVKDSAGIASGLQGIGITYDLQNNSDSALWYYSQALGINSRNGIKMGMAHNLVNTGITLKDLNRYSESYSYMTRAIEKYKEINRTDKIKSTELNIGELYCTAPDSFFSNNNIPVASRYTLAAALFNGVIDYAKDAEEKEVEAKGWQGLAMAYEKQKNYKGAYEAMNKFIALQDSLSNEEKVEIATKQTEKFEYEKKEALTKSLHDAEIAQQKTVKNNIATGGIILFSSSIILFFFYKRKRDAVARQKEAEFNNEVSETEMKALRSQMNPHFIFNSLNSIGDYISKNNTQEADKYLSKFAKLMRMILENSEQKDVPIADDLKALELYMQLEALRMNNKFSYQISVDDGIDQEATLIPPLLLQPFVENSIWHGIAQKEGTGKISIRIDKENESMINCIVEDDGIGRKQSAAIKTAAPKKEATSLGMKITQARIDILNKIKNSNAAVKLSDLEQGVRVEVRLPLATAY